jgi:hypothetical protein
LNGWFEPRSATQYYQPKLSSKQWGVTIAAIDETSGVQTHWKRVAGMNIDSIVTILQPHPIADFRQFSSQLHQTR